MFFSELGSLKIAHNRRVFASRSRQRKEKGKETTTKMTVGFLVDSRKVVSRDTASLAIDPSWSLGSSTTSAWSRLDSRGRLANEECLQVGAQWRLHPEGLVLSKFGLIIR